MTVISRRCGAPEIFSCYEQTPKMGKEDVGFRYAQHLTFATTFLLYVFFQVAFRLALEDVLTYRNPSRFSPCRTPRSAVPYRAVPTNILVGYALPYFSLT
jgi:hypothetical protein